MIVILINNNSSNNINVRYISFVLICVCCFLGALNVVMAGVGTMLGGCVITKRRLSPLVCIKLLLVINSISVLLGGVNFIFGCDNVDIVGVNIPDR